MQKQTFRGSCHCGRVVFEAGIDLSQGTSKCNCTSCWKKRWWSVRCQPSDFRAISGEAELVDARSVSTSAKPSGFCKHCGVQTYAWVEKSDWNPEAYVAISVAALDDLDPATLVAAPIQYCDGRADNWWQPPAETRHL
jgi:hypothetical protein